MLWRKPFAVRQLAEDDVLDLHFHRRSLMNLDCHDSLQLALSGRFAGYLAPVLVGPEKRIADTAAIAGLDLSHIETIDTEDEPFAAAQRAVAMAHANEVRALIKGSLYPDDLMRAVAVEIELAHVHR